MDASTSTAPSEDLAGLGNMFSDLDLDIAPVNERPKRPWNGEEKRPKVAKGKARGVHPNKPDMAVPTGLFAEFMDPRPEYYEEGGLRRVRPYQCVVFSRGARGRAC